MKKLNFYYLDLKFIRNLTRVDDNVMSISPQRGKENRPFVGIIVLVNGRNYCIPLTSPKYKFMNMKSQVIFERGLRKGEAKGKQKALIKKICCKLRKLKSVEQIADELEEDYSRVKVICDTAMNFAPDYDEEKVINAVLEPVE